MDIKLRYERREGSYNKLLRKQEKVDRQISNLRPAIFIIGISAAVLMYMVHNYILFTAVLVLFTAIFIYFVVRHGRIKDNMKYTTLLRDINTLSLKRLKGEWNTFIDDGEDFVDSSHNYSGDLDIFGKNSLFQWINTANTFIGRHKLSELLLGIIGNSDDIRERQEAVDEMATMLTWRQRFVAEGMLAKGKMQDPAALIHWTRESSEAFRKAWVIFIVRICPVVTILLALTGFVLNKIPYYLPVAALVLQFALLSYKKKERYQMFSISENYADDLKVYYKMMKLFEKRNFKSPHIKDIKDGIKDKEGLEFFKQIDKLSSIIEAISNRRNLFYVFFNILALWDFQNIIALERWKQKSEHVLEDWFDALGRMEALASLAVIRFENSDWVMPMISDGKEAVFETKGIGHPLLTEKSTHNDFAIDHKVKVLLITGSNMSGKSTLLRTAGINLVLAYAGAPVCARWFQASIMGINTCMRVTDNLGDNISSFYAELLRIKKIVKEAETGRKVFFLLDEIFKGTNSLDRHTGAKVLINKLSLTNSIGLVSTHDLELCELERENNRIANYHFQEYYKDGRIYFDYQLRPGPSTTRNALYLMQLAGIDVDENTLSGIEKL
ncbi:MAG: DNA mismatch repair protein MutS [Desulfotomaculaceae bacterium]|nr:DNA mismatch repair protein MutS [Desulfotomaculaceae bacterium]